MNRVEFADTTYLSGVCIDNERILIIKMEQKEALRHMSDFTNTNKTKKITEYSGNIFKKVFEGYTTFTGINVDNEGYYNVYLSAEGRYSYRKFFTVPREFVSEDMLSIAEFEN